MTNLEIMIRLMEELSLINAPIVFKGAMILKIATSELNLSTSRETKDIDGDWTGQKVPMAEMEGVINTALSKVQSGLICKAYRPYGNGRSAGFRIIDSNDDEIFTFDISIRENKFCQYYMTTLNNIKIVGATPQKMFTDKLAGISDRKVFRRSKDIYDLYLLSVLSGYSTYSTLEILKYMGRELRDFDEFKNQPGEVEHAYIKLQRVYNKPPFQEVYQRVYKFIEPFIMKAYDRDYIWTDNRWV